MPKITKHGGASNNSEESFNIPIQDVDIAPNERDVLLSLGGQDIELKVKEVPSTPVKEVKAKGGKPSVGNNSSTSSKPTQTIDELLGKDVL